MRPENPQPIPHGWLAIRAAHERERERLRREIELAKQQAADTLAESYELLDQLNKLLNGNSGR